MELYGGLSLAVTIVMAADVATGVSLALSRGDFRSREMRAGFWRKIAEITALFGLIGCESVARLAGVDLSLPFGFIGGAVYITTMEAASIVENLKAAVEGEKGAGNGSED